MNGNQNIETLEQETPPVTVPQEAQINDYKEENTTGTHQETIKTSEELPHLRPKLRNLIEDILKGTPRIEAHKNAKFKAKNDAARAQQVANYLQKDYVKQYISIRQDQINADLRAKSLVTRESLSKEYQLIIDECKLQKDVAWKRLQRETIDSQAKLHGLSIDRIKVDQPVVLPDIQKMEKKDRKTLIQQLEDKLPAGIKVN